MATLTETDAFAIAMIGVMLLALAVIASLWFCMRASAARRDHHVDDLLDEMSDEESAGKQVPSDDSPPAEPWEREGDWWKK